MSSQFFQRDAAQRWRYDVFLSFRGEDTRRTFTSHLYYTLKEKGVNVFIDDDRLQRGEDLSTAFTEAIRHSRILVIVFSRNYAESRWCLQELAEIIQCSEIPGQTVLPVFYNVNPSEVRNQTGSFGESLQKHEEKLHSLSEEGKTAIARWRAALTAAGNLKGWDLTKLANGVEAKIIRDIVTEVWNELRCTNLDVAEYPIGLDSQVNQIIEQLNVDLEDGVRFVGICGMGGIGKTTVAKALYNKLFCTFEAKCFLASVREQSEQPNGLVHLQEQLLFDLLNQKIEIGNVHRGITVIKESLRNRKVLIVIDDVSDTSITKALARQPEWFGQGSRIIFTTRNEDLLKDIKVDYTYMVEVLNHDHSLNLFNFHAFSSCNCKKEFMDLSEAVVTYCQGMPLALEILGSFFSNRSYIEWKSALEKLRKIPHNDVQKQLQLSYDELDDNEKGIFLHVACFFFNCYKVDVIKVLDSCGLFGDVGIRDLTKRCLLKVERGILVMHDLIRDMGREIVRRESPDNPGNRSRLWSLVDVRTTLENHSGTHNVQALQLFLSKKAVVDAASFAGMSGLKVLILNNVYVCGEFQMFSRDLRYLFWYDYPLSFMPNFHMGNLVTLSMRYSKLKSPWKAMQLLGNLKTLNLSYSSFLTNTPDFSRIPNLEVLVLVGCIKLKHISGTIGQLQHLVEINLKDCKELQSLPNTISMLKSLQYLDIRGFSKMTMLPFDIGKIESLIGLDADGTAIVQVPHSIMFLKNLRRLVLCGIKSSSEWTLTTMATPNSQLTVLPCRSSPLRLLSLRNCNLSNDLLLTTIGYLENLQELDLSGNSFSQLPGSVLCLPNLHRLCLDYCTKLQSLPDLPQHLHHFQASWCTALENVSLVNVASRSECHLVLRNCSKLEEVFGLDMWNVQDDSFWWTIRMEGCNSLAPKFEELLLKDWGVRRLICIPGSTIPEWVEYQSVGDSLSFQLPLCQGCKIQILTFCCTYEATFQNDNLGLIINVRNKITEIENDFIVTSLSGSAPFLFEDQMVIYSVEEKDVGKDLFGFAGIPSNHGLCAENEVEVVVRPSNGGMIIKNVGVHLHRQLCQLCQATNLAVQSS